MAVNVVGIFGAGSEVRELVATLSQHALELHLIGMDRPENASPRARVATHDRLDALSDCEMVIVTGPFDEQMLERVEDTMTGGAILAAYGTTEDEFEKLHARAKRPAQMVGLHFFDPAQPDSWAEIVTTEKTAPGVVLAARQFCTRLGKRPAERAHTEAPPPMQQAAGAELSKSASITLGLQDAE